MTLRVTVVMSAIIFFLVGVIAILSAQQTEPTPQVLRHLYAKTKGHFEICLQDAAICSSRVEALEQELKECKGKEVKE
jgi:hypothetical protein